MYMLLEQVKTSLCGYIVENNLVEANRYIQFFFSKKF